MKNKFLLFAISFLTLFVPKTGLAQILLNENFEGGTFPPVGWSNSTYVGTNITTGYGGVYQWFAMPSGQVQPFYYNPAAPTAWAYYIEPTSGISAHSGSVMAWANTGYYYGSNYGNLATPAITFSTPGTNTISFWYYYVHYTVNTTINMTLSYSATQAGPGTTFATVNICGLTYPSGWREYTINIPSAPGQFQSGDYIIFKATNTYGYYVGDTHIDDVSIAHLTPCSGVPSGSLVNGLSCPGNNFNMYFSDTLHTGLTYLWQQSPDNISWYAINNTTVTTSNITTPTYFRVIATCSTSTATYNDTASALVNPAPFYFCYCQDSVAGTYQANIGNVTIKGVPSGITQMNNGSASPILNNSSAIRNYTDYDLTVPAPTLYRDSSYSFAVTQIENTGAWVASPIRIYIDLNRNGIFEPSEKIMDLNSISATSPVVTDTFMIPNNAEVGLTGMRVIIDPSNTTPYGPCIPVSAGEVEDYIVNISYPPCNAPANAGRALTNDTLMCPGDFSGHYSFALLDTSYEKHFINYSRMWQISTDTGTSWINLPGGANQDMISLQYIQPSWYRVRMICLTNHDTTYSVVSKVRNDSAYRCYCFSMAVGGLAFDSTDIGAFSIGSDTVYYYYTPNNPQNNSHLNNVNAINGRITFTHSGIIPLFADSTYTLMVYDVMRSSIDAPAKVTVFIDYNNNLIYDPNELVYTDYSNSSNFFLTTNIHTPDSVVLDAPTGMRVILNNNTAPNIPSDDACGPYTSGETQDFVVKFFSRTASVAGISQNMLSLNLYPNPTNGKFKAGFKTNSEVKNLQITVTNITGQQVMVRDYQHINGTFSTELDMSGQARGMYFVEFIADGERIIRKLTLN